MNRKVTKNSRFFGPNRETILDLRRRETHLLSRRADGIMERDSLALRISIKGGWRI